MIGLEFQNNTKQVLCKIKKTIEILTKLLILIAYTNQEILTYNAFNILE